MSLPESGEGLSLPESGEGLSLPESGEGLSLPESGEGLSLPESLDAEARQALEAEVGSGGADCLSRRRRHISILMTLVTLALLKQ